PQYVLELPGPGWSPFMAAFGTAGFFLLLTFKLEGLAAACGLLALAMIWRWLWAADTSPELAPVDIGGGIQLPISGQGGINHSWWAMVMLLMVCASIFSSLLFAYLFLWTSAPEAWRQAVHLPAAIWLPLANACLLVTSSLML